jgi:hypothetical protein
MPPSERRSPGRLDPDAVRAQGDRVQVVRRGLRAAQLQGRRAELPRHVRLGRQVAAVQTDREDGLATIAWLSRQPWFGGKIGMFGPSYTGFVQWPIAADCPEEIGALSLHVTASRPRDMIYAGPARDRRCRRPDAPQGQSAPEGSSPSARIGCGRCTRGPCLLSPRRTSSRPRYAWVGMSDERPRPPHMGDDWAERRLKTSVDNRPG